MSLSQGTELPEAEDHLAPDPTPGPSPHAMLQPLSRLGFLVFVWPDPPMTVFLSNLFTLTVYLQTLNERFQLHLPSRILNFG